VEPLVIPSIIEVDQALYAKSYYDFFIAAFAALFPGEAFSDNWHIKATCDLLQEEFERMSAGLPRKQNIIVNMPYRSAKSLIFSVMFQAWAWTVRPSTKFICVSYGQDLANDLSRASRNLMATDWYQERWGDTWQFVGDAKRIELYANTHGGFRKSVGTGGQITGSGADMIILDDPQDPKLAASEVERLKTIRFYRDTLYSRLNKLEAGSRILVQQRLHEEDLTGYLLKQGSSRYRHICVPAELTEDLSPKEWAQHYVDGLFWHDRFSWAVLGEIKDEQGSTVYANQLLQKPSPPEGGLLKKRWFQVIPQRDFEELTRHVTPVWDFDLDTAYTAKAQNDPSAYLVSTLVDNVLYIRGAGEVRLEAPQLLRFISKLAEDNDYTSASKLYIEPKASGKTIVQLIRDSTSLNVVEAPAPATDKVTRVSAAAPFVESLRVVLIEGAWNEAFVAQCTGFPNAPHDDMVDCFTQRIARVQVPAKKQRVIA
jgi:predicted phage terminase large subunit-like protein